MPLYYALETYDGRALRNILLDRGLSPVDLSRRTRGVVSASTIKNMIHRRRPTVRTGTLEVLARALYVDESELMGQEQR